MSCYFCVHTLKRITHSRCIENSAKPTVRVRLRIGNKTLKRQQVVGNWWKRWRIRWNHTFGLLLFLLLSHTHPFSRCFCFILNLTFNLIQYQAFSYMFLYAWLLLNIFSLFCFILVSFCKLIAPNCINIIIYRFNLTIIFSVSQQQQPRKNRVK